LPPGGSGQKWARQINQQVNKNKSRHGVTKRFQNPIAPDAVGNHAQFGALCWRMHRGRVEVLLITSRDTGRWVIPKGWPMQDKPPARAAQIEAWQEAGVEGQITESPLGMFSYTKVMQADADLPCTVVVFPLQVARLVKKFPESKERRRKWFDAEKAARKVNEPQLRALLSRIGQDPTLVANPGPDGLPIVTDSTAMDGA
jgi:8-oxo-dGTP pyrophosphatase MutT (NUDIX family)